MAKAQKIDKMDLKILAVLQADGRGEQHRAGRQGGALGQPLPCPAARPREAEGDPRLPCRHRHGQAHRLRRGLELRDPAQARPHQQGAFETLIQETPQAIACYQISGNFDYIVHFICRSVGDYVSLHNELIEQEPNIASVTTNVIMSETKKFAGYPVKELVEPGAAKDG